jgi:DNA-binding response OmpR family regulator
MKNRPSILLLDEDDLLRGATALMLSHRVGKVSAAGTPEEALAFARERRFDVAVLDADPALSARLLELLRENDCMPKRVILCATEPVPTARAVEVDEVLSRPYAFDLLTRSLGGQRRRADSGVFPASGVPSRRAG